MVYKGTRFPQKLLYSREEIAELYIKGSSMYKIAKLCNCSPQSILFHLKQAGIKRRSLSDSSIIYSHDKSFFKDIDSEETAYFLGLLFSDGNIFNNVLKISLQNTDKTIIEKLKDSLQYTGPLYSITKEGNRSDQTSLTITSNNLVADLKFHGLHPNKSFTIKYPQHIPDHLHHHFIRGYFDGNGCIYNKQRAPGSGKKRYTPDYLFSIASTLELLQETQRLLIAATGLNQTKLYNNPQMKGKNMYVLTYQGGKSIRKIRDWLYKDATLFLDRKKDKFFSV